MIAENPSFGYHAVADLLGFNKNTAQRTCVGTDRPVKKRSIGLRSRVQTVSSVSSVLNEWWATDLCQAWNGRDSLVVLVPVILLRRKTAGVAPIEQQHEGSY
jgi:hypothetical protein